MIRGQVTNIQCCGAGPFSGGFESRQSEVPQAVADSGQIRSAPGIIRAAPGGSGNIIFSLSFSNYCCSRTSTGVIPVVMRHLAICAVRQYLVFPSGVVTIFNETIVTESERLLKKVAPAHCSDHFRKTLPVLGWERDLIFSAPDLTLFYIKKLSWSSQNVVIRKHKHNRYPTVSYCIKLRCRQN